MDSDFDELDEIEYEIDDFGCDPDDCDYEYVDYEKQVNDITEYLKDEHPAIFADMILKDIIK